MEFDPIVCIRKDSVRRHSKSLQHKQAVKKEVDKEHSMQHGSIEQAFQSQIKLNKAAVKTAMQTLLNDILISQFQSMDMCILLYYRLQLYSSKGLIFRVR